MIARATQPLRNLGTLYARVTRFAPRNEVEEVTRRLLLELIQARRSELQRELFKSRIRLKGWPLRGVR